MLDSRTIAVSNSPPLEVLKDGTIKEKLSGGAVRVILESGVSMWMGPGRVVPRAEYDKMSEAEKFPTTPTKTVEVAGRSIDFYLTPVPDDLKKPHYNKASNTALWALHHMMESMIFIDPLKAMGQAGVPEKIDFHMDRESAKADFEKYFAFNDIISDHLSHLKEAGVIRPQDKIHVQDYQMANVEGDIFSFHIPVPTLAYLKSIDEIMAKPTPENPNPDTVPLLSKDGWFNQYIQAIVEKHKTISFQTPADQENFLEILNHFDQRIHLDNPAEFHLALSKDTREYQQASVRDAHLGEDALTPRATLQPMGIDSAAEIALHDSEGKERRVRLVNVPVGTSLDADLWEAKTYAGLFDPSAPRTPELDSYKPATYDPEKLAQGGIEIAGVTNPTVADIVAVALQPGHKFSINAARNDPSKDGLAQLDAAAKVFDDHPDAKGKLHFIIYLPPSRDGIEAYKNYGNAVMKRAKELRENHGDGIIVIPGEIPHNELMALERHPNGLIKEEGATVDGQALTAREPIHARSDWTRAQHEANPLAVVAAEGLGATKILGGNATEEMLASGIIGLNGEEIRVNKGETPGIFTFPSYREHKAKVHAMAAAMGKVWELNKTPEGRSQLADRFEVMLAGTIPYSGKNWGDVIHAVNDAEQIGVNSFSSTPPDQTKETYKPEPALFGMDKPLRLHTAEVVHEGRVSEGPELKTNSTNVDSSVADGYILRGEHYKDEPPTDKVHPRNGNGHSKNDVRKRRDDKDKRRSDNDGEFPPSMKLGHVEKRDTGRGSSATR